MGFNEAVEEFNRLFKGDPKSVNEAEWFYIKAQLDMTEEDMKKRGLA